MFVIGVSGQARFGKDVLADRLREKLNDNLKEKWAGKFLTPEDPEHILWTRAAFAANVKKVYEDTFGVDREFTEGWKTKDEVPPGFDMTVRKSLQFIGDGFREIRGTIWVDLCFRDNIPKIISDVRYVNEFVRVKKEGGLNILIGRPDKLNDDPNGSEAMIKPYCEWALNYLLGVDVDKKFFDLTGRTVGLHMPADLKPPKGFEMFDVFIRNDGTKEDFYDIIDKQLVPFVEKFVFDFPEQEEPPKEKECLISS